ncbi:beta-propeller fold lactonase family protein [Methylobacterium nigriterrae]|uniref:beta-propeller fold lactonase family protein n=1 Tax=Methylobacterium nigriterrae TaxID=3127512 RepID=UPI003D67412C
MRTLSQAGGRLRAGLSALALLAALPAFAAEAVVTVQGDNAVEILDLAAGTVAARIPVPGSPAGVALSPDRRTAYVTRPDGPGLAILDIDARKVTGTLPLPGGPLGIACNPASGTVYVADWYGKRLFVLTPKDGTLVPDGEIAVGASPSGIAVSLDGATLLVANREADTVSVIDAASRRETKVIPVGKHPFGITLDAEGKRAYTANVLSDDVSVIDVAAGREIGRVKTGERPYVVALARGRGFVTDQYTASVTVFDLATLKPERAIDVGDHPEGVAASRDGSRVYVANWGDNTVSVIDADTLGVTNDIPVGDGPRAFGDFLR